jgi:ribosomal-protein-alanine N-acetyltransferase
MECAVCGKPTQFRCSVCGSELCFKHSRIAIVCRECVPIKQAKVHVRVATEADRKEIVQISKNLLFFDRLNEFDEKGIQLDKYLLGVVNGNIAGFITTIVHGDVASFELAVKPEYQRMGIGSFLIFTFKEWAIKQGASSISVATSSDNIPAIITYLKNGFKISKIAVDYYPEERKTGIFGLPHRDEITFTYRL